MTEDSRIREAAGRSAAAADDLGAGDYDAARAGEAAWCGAPAATTDPDGRVVFGADL